MITFTTELLLLIIVIISIFHDLYLISKLILLVVFVFVMFRWNIYFYKRGEFEDPEWTNQSDD